jgi:putative aldouronate transport system substrate-binding protein
MYFDNSGFRFDFESAQRSIEPEARYEIIPTMTNSLGQTRNTMYDLNWPEQHYVIATSSEKIDVALAYFNWAFSEEGANTNGYGILGESYDIVDGVPIVKNEAIDAVLASGTNTPSYEFQSLYGLGLNDFTPYVDNGAADQIDRYIQAPEDLARLDATNERNNNDKGLMVSPYASPLTPDETARVAELKTAVENIILPEIDKYITGLEPIDNYDAVIQRARDAGATEVEEIYNNANAR